MSNCAALSVRPLSRWGEGWGGWIRYLSRVHNPLLANRALTRTRSAPTAAAVHVDGVRRHERASIRAHKQHQLADFLGLAKSLHRHVVEEALHQFRRRLRRALERGADRA